MGSTGTQKPKVEFGIVKKYTRGSKFGVAVTEAGVEVFFHLEYGRKMLEDTSAEYPYRFREDQKLEDPHYARHPQCDGGEEIALIIVPGRKRPQALRWGFADELKTHTPMKPFSKTALTKRDPERSQQWGGHHYRWR